MARNPADNASFETENREQDDADAQAQSVADDALGRAADQSEDSERGGRSDPAALTPDDVPDIVDRMEQMVSSGRLDMDAFRGEPDHDDEPGMHGNEDADSPNDPAV